MAIPGGVSLVVAEMASAWIGASFVPIDPRLPKVRVRARVRAPQSRATSLSEPSNP